jgi:hypothetical protein
MKNIYLAALLIPFLIIGCKSNINSPVDSLKYPSGLNNQWEYNTIYKNIYYNSSGNPEDSSEQNLGNTIVRIAGINQVIGSISNLTLFECYDSGTPTQIEKDWYLNADSGFYAVAYANAGGSQTVIPKIGVRLNYLNSKNLKHFSLMPAFELADRQYPADSVLYYYTPRQILAYPLKSGKRWIELIAPFYRERYVDNMENVQINNVTYRCFIVEADMATSHFKMIDDISPDYGLIRRTIIMDSLAQANPDGQPTGIITKSISVSTLVQKNF